MIRRPPRSTLLTHSFPTRRSSDLVVVRVRHAEVQDVALVVDRCPGATQAVAAAVGSIAGQFAAEPAGGHAPVVAAIAVTDAEAARPRVGAGCHGLGAEVVVLARRPLFQAAEPRELAGLQVDRKSVG